MDKRNIDVRVDPYKMLQWRMVVVLLAAALLPLALSGFGSWIVFGQLIEQKSIEQMRTVVLSHARAIESNLSENLHLLQLMTESHNLREISRSDKLKILFDNLNRSSNGGFIDLGVIDADGNHLAYVGPYDLRDRNYRDADWFKEVISSGAYISDVFLGYRQIPHCIIAVKSVRDNRPWILRATINSEQFDRLVKSVPLAEGGSAYILNREGVYQTVPKDGDVLERGAVSDLTYHGGVREKKIKSGDTDLIRVTTWINKDRWLLVVEQDEAAIQAPVNQAIASGALVVAFAIFLLVIATFLATWHLTNRIKRVTAERDEMSQAFIRSAKLASIGELATGLAHEINNPLAIISAEQTNISDLLKEYDGNETSREEITESIERCKAQVQRCAGITRKMLQFGRQKDSRLESVELASRLTDIATLLQRRAKVHNIEIVPFIEENLPPVYVDPIELEQVLVNLINNSFAALPDGGKITLRAYLDDNVVHLEVVDDGTGIPAAELEHIFEPFFTTKEVGKGTGLGLSVCYGIIQSWGGRIKAESHPGQGTTMHISLPYRSTKEKNKDK